VIRTRGRRRPAARAYGVAAAFLVAATLVSAQRPIDWNIAAAVGVVTVIPMLIFSLLVQRYIVRGLTAGAVK